MKQKKTLKKAKSKSKSERIINQKDKNWTYLNDN